jgi:hypothetical protein
MRNIDFHGIHSRHKLFLFCEHVVWLGEVDACDFWLQNGTLCNHMLSCRGRHVWYRLPIAEGYELLNIYFRWRPCMVIDSSEDEADAEVENILYRG